MIFELRTYELFTHNRRELHARFQKHTVKFFEKHGFDPIGFWETTFGPAPELTYLLRWKDHEERERAWAAFYADEEWAAIREATNREHGQLVGRQMNKLLKPTAYSPAQ